MSKTYETKRKILRMCYTSVNTTTDISRKLGLAPSTVSKHIKDLEAGGALELVYNPYFRKTKYYRLVPYSNSEVSEYPPMQMSTF